MSGSDAPRGVGGSDPPSAATRKATGKTWEARWKTLDWQLVLIRAASQAGIVNTLSKPHWGAIKDCQTRLATAFRGAANRGVGVPLRPDIVCSNTFLMPRQMPQSDTV